MAPLGLSAAAALIVARRRLVRAVYGYAHASKACARVAQAAGPSLLAGKKSKKSAGEGKASKGKSKKKGSKAKGKGEAESKGKGKSKGKDTDKGKGKGDKMSVIEKLGTPPLDEKSCRALCEQVELGNWFRFEEAVEANGAVLLFNPRGEGTILHQAASRGDLPAIQMILEATRKSDIPVAFMQVCQSIHVSSPAGTRSLSNARVPPDNSSIVSQLHRRKGLATATPPPTLPASSSSPSARTSSRPSKPTPRTVRSPHDEGSCALSPNAAAWKGTVLMGAMSSSI